MGPSEHLEMVEEGPARLAEIQKRLLRPGPAFIAVSQAAEARERAIFDSYNGKYVQTGALRASLTSRSSGAVRRMLPTGFEFGTSVFYARFQGTTGPGKHRPPSAILKATKTEAALAARLLAEYILHGAGGFGRL